MNSKQSKKTLDIMVNIDSLKLKKMLEESKPILFFNKIGRLFSKCENIYFFERGSSNKIIGRCKLGTIHFIESAKIGTYGMLPFYVKYILEDNYLSRQIEKVYELKLDNYDKSLKLDYIYNLEGLKKLQKDENFSFFSLSQNEMTNYLEKQEMSKKLVNDCDIWLREQGYYDRYEETNYHYFIECNNLELIDLNLSDFSKHSIPKGWYYCERL